MEPHIFELGDLVLDHVGANGPVSMWSVCEWVGKQSGATVTDLVATMRGLVRCGAIIPADDNGDKWVARCGCNMCRGERSTQ